MLSEAKQRTQTTKSQYWHLFSMITSHIPSITPNRNWPSGPQEEVFKRVGTLHSGILCLQIKRTHLLTAINWTHKHRNMLAGIKLSKSWVYSTAAALCTAITWSLCNGELLLLHIEQQKGLLQFTVISHCCVNVPNQSILATHRMLHCNLTKRGQSVPITRVQSSMPVL